jgi:hypothetical protein
VTATSLAPTPGSFTVTNNSDSGAGSLRQAIFDANATVADDIIDFNFATGTSPYTITITTALPNIVDASTAGTLTINGLGASSLTIDANKGNFSIFSIDTGGNLTISGVTVTGANNSSGNGGAFFNSGTLNVTNSIISGNTASAGGGIFNSISGTLTVNNSTISSNTAGFAGGGIRNSGGIVTVNNSTISLNTSNFSAGISATGALPLSPIPPYSAMLRRAWVGASACSASAPSFPSPIPPSRKMLDLAAAASTMKTALLTLPTPSSLTAPVVEITPAITTPS